MIKVIDCTLRDGGYYNQWDFDAELVSAYLSAMSLAKIDFVELGFRSFDVSGFKGACAYTTDSYIRSLAVPDNLKISVMINASELISHPSKDLIFAAKSLFVPASKSPVNMVRIACHLDEFELALEVVSWLKSVGYLVGINLMQIADRTDEEIEKIALMSSRYSVDVLYFADSMGSLDVERTSSIVRALKRGWAGELGIHAHDNMGRAIANTVKAVQEGATWVDSTVTGMGRGPGNTQTEYLLLELKDDLNRTVNMTPLLALIKKYFLEMKHHYGWGENPYYYLAGKYAIHPTYIQQMLGDPRYSESEILAAIEQLRLIGGKKYNSKTLELGRQKFSGEFSGDWTPKSIIEGKNVLILGAGQSLKIHLNAIQRFILEYKPYVIALNTQQHINPELINLRAACHPFRLIADAPIYSKLGQSVVLPFDRLSDEVKKSLDGVRYLNFGHDVKDDIFEFHESRAITPNQLVLGYALAVATSGKASSVLLAGFDGYGSEDPRTLEVARLLERYKSSLNALQLLSITPTSYNIPTRSVYSFQ